MERKNMEGEWIVDMDKKERERQRVEACEVFAMTAYNEYNKVLGMPGMPTWEQIESDPENAIYLKGWLAVGSVCFDVSRQAATKMVQERLGHFND